MRPDRIIVLLFCVILAFLAILFLLLPQTSFSISEKRAMQSKPKFGFSKLVSGQFAKEVDDWFADQFPARDLFVGTKALLSALTGQNNGILQGESGQLARWNLGTDGDALIDRVDESHLRACCTGLRRAIENAEFPTVVLLPPRNLDVAQSAFDYPDLTGTEISTILQEELSGTVRIADVEPVLQEQYENGETVVFRTDHHWTVLGAYYAYCEVMKQFGRESDILPQSAFREEVVTAGFSGTYRARGCMSWIAKEELSVWLGEDEDSYSILADGKKLDGFYSIPADGEIGYELFLDGTHDVVTITKSGENREKLVVFKDSFANSLAPFLARHFDLVLLNLSSPKKDFTNITKTAGEYGADTVLLEYSVYNLLTTDTALRFQ